MLDRKRKADQLAPNTEENGVIDHIIALAKAGNKIALEALIKSNVSINISQNHERAVRVVASQNDVSATELLLELGGSLNFAAEGAAINGNFSFCKQLIDRGACVNYAVRGAARAGHIEFVKDLIDKSGASLTYALQGAKRGAQTELIDYLILCGASTDNLVSVGVESNLQLFASHLMGDTETSEVMAVAKLQNLRQMETYTERGVLVSKIIKAIRTGNSDSIESIINKIQDNTKLKIVLDIAVLNTALIGDVYCTAALLRLNAEQGYAMLGAVMGENLNIISHLTITKAVNDFGRVAAALSGNIQLLNRFITSNCDLNSAAAAAAHQGHLEVVKYLITRGACPSSCLKFAVISKQFHVINYLTSKEAAFIVTVELHTIDRFIPKDREGLLQMLSLIDNDMFRKSIALSVKLVDGKNIKLLSIAAKQNYLMRTYGLDYHDLQQLKKKYVRTWFLEIERRQLSPTCSLPADLLNYISSFVLALPIEKVKKIRTAIHVETEKKLVAFLMTKYQGTLFSEGAVAKIKRVEERKSRWISVPKPASN